MRAASRAWARWPVPTIRPVATNARKPRARAPSSVPERPDAKAIASPATAIATTKPRRPASGAASATGTAKSTHAGVTPASTSTVGTARATPRRMVRRRAAAASLVPFPSLTPNVLMNPGGRDEPNLVPPSDGIRRGIAIRSGYTPRP